MLTNELLEAKYQAQRVLAEQGGPDLRSYAQHVHQVVRRTERQYGLQFRYGRVRKTGAVRPKSTLQRPSPAQVGPVVREAAG